MIGESRRMLVGGRMPGKSIQMAMLLADLQMRVLAQEEAARSQAHTLMTVDEAPEPTAAPARHVAPQEEIRRPGESRQAHRARLRARAKGRK